MFKLISINLISSADQTSASQTGRPKISPFNIPVFFNIQLYMIWHIGCKNPRFNNNFDLPKRHVPITTGEDIPLYLETTRQQAKTYHFYVKPPWSSYLCPKIQTLKQMFSGSFYQHLGYF